MKREKERKKKGKKERNLAAFLSGNFEVVLFIYLLKLCGVDIILRKVIVRCFPGVLLHANSANINVTSKASF